MPQINIFAPDDDRYIDADISMGSLVEDKHDIAPTVDINEASNIVNEQYMASTIRLPQQIILDQSNLPELTTSTESEKRVKQPGTFYRCVNPINWKPIEHGKSITVYEESVVTRPEQCNQETRVCDNGTMLWSYIEVSCQQLWDWCVWPDWKSYPHGWVGTYYLHDEVIGKPEDGEDICVRQARVCQGWSWYLFDRNTKSDFTYKYSYCNAKIQ